MSFRFAVPQELRGAFDRCAADWQTRIGRFWQKDPTLWTNNGEEKWMGWIDIVERQQKDLAVFRSLAAEAKEANFENVLLLGMGGSSLCPEVLSLTFGRQPGFPALQVVDSTDPAQIKAIRDRVDLHRTLVIVASKSGSTLEPNIFKQYFFAEIEQAVGAAKAGSRFLAITDPGSEMEQLARSDSFRHVFFGDPAIGGRYSALSSFGVVAAAVTGLDVARLIDESAKAVAAAKLPPAQNPALQLGILLGVANNAGRDKLTIFTSPEIRDLGAWLEQLLAESTGKQGRGVTPVDRETIAAPEIYGHDRVFAYIKLAGTADPSQDAHVAALEAAGHPVVCIEIADRYEFFGQFFSWEFATAVAGSLMGIDPFNQPDVESAKVEARELMSQYEKTGRLPYRRPMHVDQGVEIYASDGYADRLKSSGTGASLGSYLKDHLSQIHAGDYFAILAFLPMFPENERALQAIRHRVRDTKRVATCLGFGPRFLHSTGQDYKGGPNSGVFLQITGDHPLDLAIPGQKYSFGVVIDAQAAGDLAVLESRGRRVMRLHLKGDPGERLKTVCAAVDRALLYR